MTELSTQADVGTNFTEEAFSQWTLKLVHYIGWTEATNWERRVIRDDKVTSIEFGIIYN